MKGIANLQGCDEYEQKHPLNAARLCRPLSKDEVANGTQQVITCNERAREVTLSQNVGGKHLGRAFHFDKV